MPLETVSVVADQSWQLISNAGAGRFAARVLDGTEALFAIGTTAPAADSVLGFPARELRFDNLDGKVWVRGAGIDTVVSVVRVVDAGNPAVVLLKTPTLSTTTIPAGASPGTVLATIGNRTPGSNFTITPNDGRFAISDDGTTARLVAGLSAISAGASVVTLSENHPKAPNSPKRTSFTLTASDAFIPANNRMAWSGDSRTLSQWQTTGGGYMEAKGAAMWVVQMGKGAVRHALADSFGTGGFSTTQVLSGHFQSALASGCGIIAFQAGCNDPQSGSVANVGISIANAQAARDQAVAAGKLIVFCTEPTAPSIGALGSANDNWIRDYSTALMAMHNPAQGVIVADCRKAFAEYIAAHGGDTTKVYRDGIHWTGTGGLLWAKTMWGVLARHVASFATDLFARAGSLNDVLAALDGTGGTKGAGITGDLATGWSGSVTNGTVACSKVEKDGFIGQRFVGTFTAAGGSFNLFADYAPAGTGIASGDVMDFVCGFQNNAEAIGIRQAQFSARYNGGTVIPSFLDGANPQQSSVGFQSLGLPYEGIYRPVNKAVPGAANRLHALFTVDMATDATAGSFDFTIWRPQFRKAA